MSIEEQAQSAAHRPHYVPQLPAINIVVDLVTSESIQGLGFLCRKTLRCQSWICFSDKQRSHMAAYLDERSVDNAWRYTVHIHISVSPLSAKRLRDLDHSCLGSIVGYLLLWVWDQQGCHTGGVDDLAIALS